MRHRLTFSLHLLASEVCSSPEKSSAACTSVLNLRPIPLQTVCLLEIPAQLLEHVNEAYGSRWKGNPSPPDCRTQ